MHRHDRFRFLAGVFLFSIAVGIDSPVAADWPNFRGPNHDGISTETGLRTTWNEPIPMLWDKTIGSSFSSFACVGNRIFTCGTEDGRQTLLAVNANSGETIWKIDFEDEYREPQGGDGTRATPTVDGDRVYILGARGTLLCVAADSGKTLWSKKYGNIPQWGYSGSVLIEGDKAIVSVGSSDGALLALNKKNGKTIWKSGDDAVGYATPYPFTFNGQRYIVGFTAQGVMIVNADDGREVWRERWKTDWGVNAAAPIFHDGHLFISSGYRTGCAVYRLKADGRSLTGEQVWKSRVLMNKFQSCILRGGKLYASDQKALVCADFKTGEEHWRQHRKRHGTLILADDHLFYLSQRGELQIGPVSPTEFSPTTTAEILSGRCWTVPVIHNGKLYARSLDRIACFDLKAK